MSTQLNLVTQKISEGFSYAKIARELGYTRSAVQNYCKRHKIDKPGKTVVPSALSVKKAKFSLPAEFFTAASLKFLRKKQNAKKGKWEFTVQFEDIPWVTHCPILGLELDYYSEKRLENSPSFDRIDCTKGYVPGNVHVISWRANRIKNDGNLDDFKKIVAYLDK